MNFRELAAELGLEQEEYLELVQIFIDTGRSDLQTLQTALDAGRIDEVVSASHSLKGAAMNFGFLELSELARDLEVRGRQGSLEGAAEPLQALSGWFAALAETFEAEKKSLYG